MAPHTTLLSLNPTRSLRHMNGSRLPLRHGRSRNAWFLIMAHAHATAWAVSLTRLPRGYARGLRRNKRDRCLNHDYLNTTKQQAGFARLPTESARVSSLPSAALSARSCLSRRDVSQCRLPPTIHIQSRASIHTCSPSSALGFPLFQSSLAHRRHLFLRSCCRDKCGVKRLQLRTVGLPCSLPAALRLAASKLQLHPRSLLGTYAFPLLPHVFPPLMLSSFPHRAFDVARSSHCDERPCHAHPPHSSVVSCVVVNHHHARTKRQSL